MASTSLGRAKVGVSRVGSALTRLHKQQPSSAMPSPLEDVDASRWLLQWQERLTEIGRRLMLIDFQLERSRTRAATEVVEAVAETGCH